MTYRKSSTSQYHRKRTPARSQGYQLNFDRFHSDDGEVACRYCGRLQPTPDGNPVKRKEGGFSSMYCPVPKRKEVAEIADEKARARECEFFEQWEPKRKSNE